MNTNPSNTPPPVRKYLIQNGPVCGIYAGVSLTAALKGMAAHEGFESYDEFVASLIGRPPLSADDVAFAGRCLAMTFPGGVRGDPNHGEVRFHLIEEPDEDGHSAIIVGIPNCIEAVDSGFVAVSAEGAAYDGVRAPTRIGCARKIDEIMYREIVEGFLSGEQPPEPEPEILWQPY